MKTFKKGVVLDAKSVGLKALEVLKETKHAKNQEKHPPL